MRRFVAALILVVCLAAAPGASGSSAGANLPTLNVAYLPDVGYAPFFVARWEGLFKKYGVNVNLEDVPFTVLGAEVAGGQIDLATSSASEALAVSDQGMPVSLVYSLTQNPGYALVTTASIPTLAALRSTSGCRISVGSTGGLGYGWYLEYKAKLDLGNCSELDEPSIPATIAALASGSVQAAVVAMGTAAEADAAPPNGVGAHLLVDPIAPGWKQAYAGLEPYPVALPAAMLWGLSSNLQAKRSAVVSMIAALDQAMRLITPANYTKVAAWIRLGDPTDFGSQSIAEIVQGLQGEGPWIGMNAVILPKVAKGHAEPNPNTLVGYISPFSWSSLLASLVAVGQPNFDPTAPANQYAAAVDMSYWRQAYRQYLRKNA